MAITLGPHTLPNGLRWRDEFDWSPDVSETGNLVSGAVLVEVSTRLAGRPITLQGGRTWAWMTRSQLDALWTTLTTDVPDEGLLLTLHDGSTYTVLPRLDRGNPISARPVPIVRESGPADPVAGSKYFIEEIRLIEIGTEAPVQPAMQWAEGGDVQWAEGGPVELSE